MPLETPCANDVPYHATVGAGADMVLLHGWGMHAGVWEDVVEELADHHRVTVIDLPGHGFSRACGFGPDLGALTARVAAVAPQRAVWVGWSLGGLVAQRLALDHPQRVAGLALVASSPCFVARPDWPHAMERAVLHQFAEGLGRDYRATLNRFLALEVHGSQGASTQLRQLKAMIFQHGEPDPRALADGLEILETTDLRPELSKLSCPLLLLLGRRDNLVPASLGAAIQARVSGARLRIFEEAGHAPFFSHLRDFTDCLGSFADDC